MQVLIDLFEKGIIDQETLGNSLRELAGTSSSNPSSGGGTSSPRQSSSASIPSPSLSAKTVGPPWIVQSYTKVATEKKNEVRTMVRNCGFVLKWKHNNKNVNTYTCQTHKECQLLFRTRPADEDDRLPLGTLPAYVLESKGSHSAEVSCPHNAKDGIPAEHREKVDLLLKSGQNPTKVLNSLRKEVKLDPAKLQELNKDVVKKISNRRRALVRQAHGPYKIENVADLYEFTVVHRLPEDLEEAKRVQPTKLVVLRNGEFDIRSHGGYGFAFSTLELLRNAVRAKEAWGDEIPLMTDGTYKLLHNGWVLIPFGTISLRYDDHQNRISQQFRPIAFMFCGTECAGTYGALFQATIKSVEFLFGYRIECSVAESDRAIYIKQAFNETWPSAKWTTCYPHIARKVEGNWATMITDRKNFSPVAQRHLALLHACRTQQQFDNLKVLVVQAWRRAGEKTLADTVETEYFNHPYNVWYATATGIAGVTPNSNAIEAWNGLTKRNKLDGNLRIRLDHMLSTVLPQVLLFDSLDLVSPIKTYVKDLIPSQCAEKAGKYRSLDILEWPTGSGIFYVNRGASLGKRVTEERVRDYLASLNGPLNLSGRSTPESFDSKYMSLHRVTKAAFEREGCQNWECDCLGFSHDVVCAHVLVVRGHCGEVDIAALNTDLPKRSKPGRKRKQKGCLHPEGPNSPPASKQGGRAR